MSLLKSSMLEPPSLMGGGLANMHSVLNIEFGMPSYSAEESLALHSVELLGCFEDGGAYSSSKGFTGC
jgi:hypothetical protein